jgi:hypothetical protein
MSIYYLMGDSPVHKLPFGPKCHELFVILYSILYMQILITMKIRYAFQTCDFIYSGNLLLNHLIFVV